MRRAPERTGVLEELRRELFEGFDPYEDADRSMVDRGYPHTFLPAELIQAVLRHAAKGSAKPCVWLEIGSMVGGSALRTLETAAENLLPVDVICLDPFTADAGAWEDHARAQAAKEWDCLRLLRGRPQIYERFLANVATSRFQGEWASESIFPLVMTSVTGLRLLRRLHTTRRVTHLPDVVYLDSAHEPGETRLELEGAWSLLSPGGVLFGDDWDWPGVKFDVGRFARDVRPSRNVYAEDHLLRNLSAEAFDGVCVYKNQWLLVKG